MVRQDGKEARLKLVVSGIVRKVVVNLFIASFWKIKTGRVPACSEPRIGLRFASQISPRLTVIECPLSSDVSRNPPCPAPQAPGPRRRSSHNVLPLLLDLAQCYGRAKRPCE